VVGRSAVVGKPLLHLLLQGDATVTICHSRSAPLERFTRPAAVVIVAAGRPGLLTADHLSPGAVVVDVGTNVLADGSLVATPTIPRSPRSLPPSPRCPEMSAR
jgi:methylenetetrahydrofolate dehydrogenase (NADP+)/methenyltetrahydrofolate cyclohydrolase